MGTITGVVTVSGAVSFVKVAATTSLLVMPSFTAMALMVVVAVRKIGVLYNSVLDVVGSLPSVV